MLKVKSRTKSCNFTSNAKDIRKTLYTFTWCVWLGNRGCECCFTNNPPGTVSKFPGGGDTGAGSGSEHCRSTLAGGTVKYWGDKGSASGFWLGSLSLLMRGCLIKNRPRFVPIVNCGLEDCWETWACVVTVIRSETNFHIVFRV